MKVNYSRLDAIIIKSEYYPGDASLTQDPQAPGGRAGDAAHDEHSPGHPGPGHSPLDALQHGPLRRHLVSCLFPGHGTSRETDNSSREADNSSRETDNSSREPDNSSREPVNSFRETDNSSRDPLHDRDGPRLMLDHVGERVPESVILRTLDYRVNKKQYIVLDMK